MTDFDHDPSDLVLRRQVEKLCLCPRTIFEMLKELGIKFSIRQPIEDLVERYAAIDENDLRVAGGDRMPPVPLRRVMR